MLPKAEDKLARLNFKLIFILGEDNKLKAKKKTLSVIKRRSSSAPTINTSYLIFKKRTMASSRSTNYSTAIPKGSR